MAKDSSWKTSADSGEASAPRDTGARPRKKSRLKPLPPDQPLFRVGWIIGSTTLGGDLRKAGVIATIPANRNAPPSSDRYPDARHDCDLTEGLDPELCGTIVTVMGRARQALKAALRDSAGKAKDD